MYEEYLKEKTKTKNKKKLAKINSKLEEHRKAARKYHAKEYFYKYSKYNL